MVPGSYWRRRSPRSRASRPAQTTYSVVHAQPYFSFGIGYPGVRLSLLPLPALLGSVRLSVGPDVRLRCDGRAAARTRMSSKAQPSSGQQQGFKMYVYPAAGQSDAQLSEDRYQCHVWATNQSGYDPTMAQGSARTPKAIPARSRRAWQDATMWSSEQRARRMARGRDRGRPVASCATAGAAVDLSQLQVTPQRGQSADQARRDRYECHNWAVEQTGEVPSASARAEPRRRRRREACGSESRESRPARLSVPGIGRLFGGGHNSGEDMLKGAAVGSVVGVATGAAHEKKQQKQAGPEPGSDYLRALSACLEGRGYTVAMPAPAPANAVAQR